VNNYDLLTFTISTTIAALGFFVAVLVWLQSRKDAKLAKETAEFTRKTTEEAAKLAKETAVMSVKPHLCLSTDTNDKERRFRVIIENNGVGPVIIEAFKVLLDGKEVIKDDDNKNPLKTAISKLDIEIADSYDWLIYTKGHSISVSKSQDILNFQLKQESSQENSHVFKELNRVDLVIEHNDLYGNAQITYDTRNNEMKF
jgi:archaellum component FlaF (FlaF/FlaG flagellin family)